MKNYRALVGVILRFAVIAGMWIWFDNLPQNSGSLGYFAVVPHMLVFSLILLIGACFRIDDFILSVKWLRCDPEQLNTLPPMKSRKTPLGTAVQAVLITAAAIWLSELGGIFMGLTVITVFVILKLVDK